MIALIHPALDVLSGHPDNELAQAQRKGDNARQLATLSMRQQIASARAKLSAMQVSP